MARLRREWSGASRKARRRSIGGRGAAAARGPRGAHRLSAGFGSEAAAGAAAQVPPEEFVESLPVEEIVADRARARA